LVFSYRPVYIIASSFSGKVGWYKIDISKEGEFLCSLGKIVIPVRALAHLAAAERVRHGAYRAL
jgi:hypothetical protein